MQATAKDTRAALKRHVVPLLRDRGFDDGTPSKLWRHGPDRIEHVEILCYSAYAAQSLKTTTASFEVRIALCLPGYSATLDPFHRDYVKTGPGGPRPSESQMPIRGMLCPGSSPPMTRGRWGWEVHSTWQVDSVDDAEAAAIDLVDQFEGYALDWLGRDWDYAELLELLRSDAPSPVLISSSNGSYLRLYAELAGSPIRNAHVAMVTAALAGRSAT